MKFSIKDFFGKCDQIRRKMKSLMEKFIFCTVLVIFSFQVIINNYHYDT